MLWDFIVKSREKLKVLLSPDIFLQKYSNFVQIFLRVQRRAWCDCGQQSSVGKGKASLEIFRKMKGFVLDNYLESEKIPLGLKTESLESSNVTIFYLNPLYMNKDWISAF